MLAAAQEAAAGVGVISGAVLMGVVATAAGDVAPVDVILREWGPLGMAVFVLYRRVDKLDDRIQRNADNINDSD